MYLHLGNNVLVDLKDIVAVFDMDNTTVSKKTRDFLTKAQKNGNVVDVTEDLPKSFIVAERNGTEKVYISSLASQTLYKRSKTSNFIL